MHLAFLAFIFGNIVAAQYSFPLLSALPGLLIPLCCLGLGFARLRIAAAIILGGLWVLATQQVELQRRLPATDARIEARLTGSVVSLPIKQGQATRFVFEVQKGLQGLLPRGEEQGGAVGLLNGSRIQLTWFRPEIDVQAGDRFTLHARLGAPSAAVNFDLFDYEKWMFSKRIHARGYVLLSPTPHRHADTCEFCVLKARAWFRSKLAALPAAGARPPKPAAGALPPKPAAGALPPKPAAGALPSPQAVATQLALSLGDTSLLSQQDWQILNQTGTTHLLIVSGLHVGLIASLAYALLGFVGVPLHLRVVGTILMTFAYAQLSGWGLPVQRAFLMTLAFFSASLLFRHIPLTGRFVMALVVVLVFDPLASLSRGFWLSFGVVYALIFALTQSRIGATGLRFRLYSGVRAVFLSQWVAYLALLPLIGFYTQTLPLGSLLTNLVAIPWVSLLIVPVTLAALMSFLVSDSLAEMLLVISSALIQGLWWFLQWIDGLRLILPVTAYSLFMLLCAFLGVGILLLPKGLVARWPGLFLVLLAFTDRQSPAASNVVVTFLDVGQGLSVLIETSHGAVLYDTGPGYPGGASAATHSVLPTLRGRGYRSLDTLVVSHSDDDHAGGVAAIFNGIAVQRLVQYGDCHRQWQLGDVRFESFDLTGPRSTAADPAPGNLHSDNATSCLLSVTWGRHWILLTGDIEAAEEYRLLDQDPPLLAQTPLTLLLVPHHGSGSSSTPALLNRLVPDIAIVSSGYLNRFGHPVEEVVARYTVRGIRILDTAVLGAIRIKFDPRYPEGPRITAARGEPAGVWRRRSTQ